MTNTRNTPVEALERAYPLRVLRQRLRRGSGGAGSAPGVEGIERVLRERSHTEAPSGRRNATLGALYVGAAAGMLFAASPVAADSLKAASLALAGFGVLLLLARRSWDNRRPPR